MIGTGIFFHLESSKVRDCSSVCLYRPYVYIWDHTATYSHVLIHPWIHLDTRRHIKQTYIRMHANILWCVCVCVCENCMHAQHTLTKIRQTQRLQLVSMYYQIFERFKSLKHYTTGHIRISMVVLNVPVIVVVTVYGCTFVLIDFRVRFQWNINWKTRYWQRT